VDPKYDNETVFTAWKSASYATVQAELPDSTIIDLDFIIIAPSGEINFYVSDDLYQFETGPPNNVLGHEHTFEAYITPLTVSFYNV